MKGGADPIGDFMLAVFLRCRAPAAEMGQVLRPLLGSRGRGHRHAMAAEHIHHLLAVGRAASGSTDYVGSLAEVSRPHHRRGYDGKLLRILGTRLSNRCAAPRGMHSACPGPTSTGVPSTVQVRMPSMP